MSTPHPFGQRFRALRRAKGLSLGRVEAATEGRWGSAVVGSYERDERHASLERADAYLREVFDHRVEFVPATLSDEHIQIACWLAAQDVTLPELETALAVVRTARKHSVGASALRSVA